MGIKEVTGLFGRKDESPAGIGGGGGVDTEPTDQERSFITFCRYIREKRNPSLPEIKYGDLSTPIDSEDLKFYAMYQQALLDEAMEKLIGPTIAPGNTGLPYPSGSIDILSLNITGSQEGVAGTLQGFIDALPPRIIGDLRDHIKYRFLSIQNWSNRAYAFASKTDTQWWKEYDAPIKEIGELGTKGGYTNWDLGPLELTHFEGKGYKELFGEDDVSWQLGPLTDFFINRMQEALPNSTESFVPEKNNGTRINELKSKSFALLPARFKDGSEIKAEFKAQAETAWAMAFWNIAFTLKKERWDTQAIDGKNWSRAANTRIYYKKINLEAPDAGERERPTHGIVVDRAAHHLDERIHILLDLPHDAYDLKTFADASPDLQQELKERYRGDLTAINNKVAFMKLRKEFQAFGVDTPDVGKIIAIPKAWIFRNYSIAGRDLIQVNMEQKYDLCVNGNNVLWNSITPDLNAAYKREQSLLIRLSMKEYGNAYDPAGVFTPIHDHAIQDKIQKAVDTRFFSGIRSKLESLQILFSSIRENKERAKNLDRAMRELVSIKEIPISEVVVGDVSLGSGKITIGLGTADITQYIGRYLTDESTNMGARMPDRGTMTFGSRRLSSIRFWEDILRTEADVPDSDRIVPTRIRKAIDDYEEAQVELFAAQDAHNQLAIDAAEKKRNRAKYQTIIIALWYAACMYLDQYAYDPEAHFQRTFGIKTIENDYKEVIDTLIWQKPGERKPMAFDDRKAFLYYMDTQVRELLRKWGPNLSLTEKIWVPTEADYLRAMERRGIIGSVQQEVIDWWTYKNDANRYSDPKSYPQRMPEEKKK